MKKFIVALLLLPCFLFAQEDQKENIWEPFEVVVGQWEGTGKGKSGESMVETEFDFILNKNFLQVKNKAVFDPQEANPSGEVHEDLGFISYDGNRKKFIFRQFHVEGFVNQYVLDSLSPDRNTFVFISESIENISPGWRARVVYKITDENEIRVLFDLAAPDKEFGCYSENQLRRKK